MARYSKSLIGAAMLLAMLAGFVDAYAYIRLGGFFASFMSGNSTRLAVDLADGVFTDVRTAAALVASFICGVMIASMISHAVPRHRKTAIMAMVTLLLTLAAAISTIDPWPFALILITIAMGAENGVYNRDGEVTIGLTYMTGTLVRFGQLLTGALMGQETRWAWLPYLLLWLAFLSGVGTGALMHDRYGAETLWFAAGAAAVLTVLVALLTGRLDNPQKLASDKAALRQGR